MKIISLNKDNKIKAEQLKEEASFKKFLIAAILAILFAGLYVYRNLTLKRKNEKMRREQVEQEWLIRNLESQKIQTELQRQAAELEMQALRAQMNPHFIFNCLSSINRFILKNESKAASNYLTRFSRLIRMVLINSQKPLIALEDELQMLRLYLDMERLRFKESFDFSITFLNVMDDDNIFIPPLLLQPFCENAIWHGLMHKDGHGRLEINLSLENNILYCTITDNGIGRDKAEEIKSKSAEKEKSMGLKITAERLALLNREKGVHTSYEMEDLLDENGNPAGTKVHLRISYLESVEHLA
jgi:LytS/YehU family sensor histidine kinase